MVKAIISIHERTNRILNIIKAKFGLNDKSEAIDMMAQQYEEGLLEPKLRPEYMAKLQKIKGQKGIRFKNVEELRKRVENA